MHRESTFRLGDKRARTRDHLLVSAQTLLIEHNAAALGLRQITAHAGLVHASFYNYYRDIPALIADLAELLGATHASAMAALVTGLDDPALRFARITRQTLRIVALEPGFGRLMFDIGLPTGILSPELRLRLQLDIAEGARLGLFKIGEIDLITSLVAGAISGFSLDLHRGLLPFSAIDAATTRLLSLLGLDPSEAQRLGHEAVDFPPPPILPMRWLALPPVPHPLSGG